MRLEREGERMGAGGIQTSIGGTQRSSWREEWLSKESTR